MRGRRGKHEEWEEKREKRKRKENREEGKGGKRRREKVFFLRQTVFVQCAGHAIFAENTHEKEWMGDRTRMRGDREERKNRK
jgi:hypothetical protein